MKCSSLAIALALSFPAAPILAAPVTLMFGEAAGQHVTFEFSQNRTAPDALTIETRRIGNPGAHIRIWIDNSRSSLSEMILDGEDCSFDDAGAKCTLKIGGGTETYRRYVEAFRLGRTAHIEVRNSNVMAMRDDISLKGFTAAYNR